MEFLKIYQQIDSTNKEASRLLSTGNDLHGTAILALHQTDGRGQYGRQWHAEPGLHLSMSMIIQLQNMTAIELPQLSMKVSLALIRAVAIIDNTFQPKIKWPNDIYVNGNKLAGILIENSLSANRVQHSIIGIGMNVNETAFPGHITNAISLQMLSGRIYHLEDLAALVQREVMHIIEDSDDIWKAEYDKFIYGLDRQHDFEINGDIVSCYIAGVANDGKLILQNADGERLSYFAHEIKWLI